MYLFSLLIILISLSMPAKADGSCFETRDELIAAVDAYLDRDNNRSSEYSKYGSPIGTWCVSSILDFTSIFDGARNKNAKKFNEDVDMWDIKNAKQMNYMFRQATVFNEPLWSWDVGKVESMKGMFAGAEMFAQDLNTWDTSSVKHMENMFSHGSADQANFSFNGNIGDWNVSNVHNMKAMFHGSTVFDQDLSGWDVSKVENTKSMFEDCILFNGDISTWDVSRVGDMHGMFHGASRFNSDLSKWNTRSTKDMRNLFLNATSFNIDIRNWDVSKVSEMDFMFEAAANFNQDISRWNVLKVSSFQHMFHDAVDFNQNLCPWAYQIMATQGIADDGTSDKLVDEMFYSSSCPNTDDPHVNQVSNFCKDSCQENVTITQSWSKPSKNYIASLELETSPQPQPELETNTQLESEIKSQAETENNDQHQQESESNTHPEQKSEINSQPEPITNPQTQPGKNDAIVSSEIGTVSKPEAAVISHLTIDYDISTKNNPSNEDLVIESLMSGFVALFFIIVLLATILLLIRKQVEYKKQRINMARSLTNEDDVSSLQLQMQSMGRSKPESPFYGRHSQYKDEVVEFNDASSHSGDDDINVIM